MLKFVVSVCAIIAYVAGNQYLFKSRIVNGTDAKLGEIPYIVSVGRGGGHSCGGSILDENHVLTAAHCVNEGDLNSTTIKYGLLNIFPKENVIAVEKMFKHEKYSPENSYLNDIAVLKLSRRIPFNENIKPVNLPLQNENPSGGDSAVLAGWGSNGVTGAIQRQLQRVDILIYSDDDCSKSHGSSVNNKYHLCAGVPEGGKGQCNGDSGSPLVSNGKQVGVVSWSIKPCTIKGFPGVFVRVPSYIEWIKEKLLL